MVGTEVQLRPVGTSDLAVIRAWGATRELDPFMSRFTPDLTASPDAVPMIIWQMIVAGGEEVGTVWLERASADSADAVLGIFLARPDLRGHGLGRKAIAMAERVGRERWAIARVRLHVRATNKRALSCYAAAGFRVTNRGSKLIAGQPVPTLEMIHEFDTSAQAEAEGSS
jgi:GNAT superfamily N-acetyltransferase